MKVRLAIAEEAPALWEVRNQAIRHGCRESYAAEVLQAWTPDNMPEGYRHAVRDNPFFVVDDGQGKPVASGYLISKRVALKPYLLCRPGRVKAAPA